MKMTAHLPSKYYPELDCYFDVTPVMEVKPYTPVFMNVLKSNPIADPDYFPNYGPPVKIKIVQLPMYEAVRFHLIYNIDNHWKFASMIVPIEKENQELNTYIYKLLYYGDSRLYDFFLREKDLFFILWNRMAMDVLTLEEYHVADMQHEFDKIKDVGILAFGNMPKGQWAII